jgi:hypothetical protein
MPWHELGEKGISPQAKLQLLSSGYDRLLAGPSLHIHVVTELSIAR